MEAKVFSDISSLTCCVCYEKISETKKLYCGHSICSEPCLDRLLSHDKPACPTCNVPIELPPSGLKSDLPTNYGLGSVLRSYRDTTHKSRNTCPSVGEDSLSDTEDGESGDYQRPFAFKGDEDTCSTGSKQRQETSLCSRHLKTLRFTCYSCSEDVCFVCIQTIHKAHEFDVKDASDHDAAYMKDVIVRCLRQRRQQKVISMKLLESRQGYLELSKATETEIKETAERVRAMVTAETKSLLQELQQLAASRSEYFMDLYSALENAMVRENKLLRMMTNVGNSLEDSETPIELRVIENIERMTSDIDKDTEALEHLCDCKHPHLQFNRKRISGRLIGSLVKVCQEEDSNHNSSLKGDEESLSILRLEERETIQVDRSCVSVVWLAGGRCVVVLDRTATVGNVMFSIIHIDNKDEENQTETLERSGYAPIHVCSTVSYDLRSILLVHGGDIIKVTFSDKPGLSPTYKLTESPENVEGVHWGQYTDEYFVLTSHPWQVYRVDGWGDRSLVVVLSSLWYGPLIAMSETRFIVADISDNVFVVKDTTRVFPERRLKSPGSLKKAWPAGISLNRESGEWFFLWKSISDKTADNVDWMLTRYSASFEFRGTVLDGSMAERDPRFVSTCQNKLSVLFHGGELLVFNIRSCKLQETASPRST